MEAQFVSALITLRNTDTDQFIKKLFETFSAITHMNADEVITAYQTVQTVALTLNILQDTIIQQLFSAMVAHMEGLAAQTSSLKKRFSSVTGRRIGKDPWDMFG